MFTQEHLPSEDNMFSRHKGKRVHLTIISTSYEGADIGMSMFRKAEEAKRTETPVIDVDSKDNGKRKPVPTKKENKASVRRMMEEERPFDLLYDINDKENNDIDAIDFDPKDLLYEPEESENEIKDALNEILNKLFDEMEAKQKPKLITDSRTILHADGTMKRENGRLVIQYESEIQDGPDPEDYTTMLTDVVIAEGKGSYATISRVGTVVNTLILEKGVRHISNYVTPLAPFELCVYGRECETDVTYEDGGSIYLDYYVELRGAEIQHTRMRITVKVTE